MSCNCKKKRDKLKAIADNREQLEREDYEINHKIVNKVARAIIQAVFGIVALSLIIVITVPLLLYIGGCMVIGKEPYIKLKNPTKYFTKNKKADGRDEQDD